MKRIVSLLLALALIFSLAACVNKNNTISESDTSTPTQAETESKSSAEATESSGATETPNSSNPTSSETSKPAASNPTTSNPTTSTSSLTPSTPTHTHSWGNWKTETKALIGKDGTEKRICSSCKETEKRSTKNNAVRNSFFDFYLHEYFAWFGNTVYKTTFNIDALFHCGDLIARDDYWDGDAEDIANATIPVDVYYKALKEHFVLTDDIINQMKSQRNADAYPVTMDGFTPQSIDTIVGYTHNGGNKYTVYWKSSYNEDVKPVKVELEYNLLNDKPNRYISIEYINSIPNNIEK